MSHRFMVRWVWPALLSAAILSSTAVTVSPSAAAKWAGAEPCVTSNGSTLKQQYGYSVAVVTSNCTEVPAGQRWAASVPWTMNSRFDEKPSGFATDFATPVDDFRAKIQSIEYVVDAGSAYQTNRSFPGDNKIWAGQHPSGPDLPTVNTVGLGSLDPLPVGTHTVDVSWNLSAPHCDGFTADQGTSCLPQGETLVKRITFKVVDPNSDESAES
ncbi:hypothetical protein [Mycolicibacterium stellerae]|uniref:hypothetical protein n=1 Tax=Mycolicibacterium stellerae TaxID=2358193 RepID=UPI0013DDFDB0|nr:hypothetical protein [Mycolicibacterium stellerae]